MLTAEQLRLRDGKLTASRVACLMTGDEAKIMDLWREMIGDPAYQPDALSAVWPVRMGETTEALNIEWYFRKTGRAVTRQGEVVVCPSANWAACTLDGFDNAVHAVIECKCVGGFEAREKVVARYQPQCHWAMICTQTRKTYLSIIEGGKEPVLEEIPFNDDYAAELWRRAEAFMECVRDLTPPIALAPVVAPIAPEQWRTVDMSPSNAWASTAADWIANKAAAKKFETATKEIKALVEADVGKATGHGIIASRNKAGAISIKEA